jgi:hypothetical protein
MTVKHVRRKTGGVKITKIIGPARPRSPAAPAPKMTLAEKTPGKPEAPTKVIGVDPIGAIVLRSAFGLKTDAASCERTSVEATKHVKAAVERAKAAAAKATKDTNAGGEGRPVDVPSQAAPTFMNRPAPTTQEYTHDGSQRLPQPAQLSLVWTAICEIYVAAHRQPVTLLASELAGMTGLTVQEVNAAVAELERRRLLTRQPNRAGSIPRFVPGIV